MGPEKSTMAAFCECQQSLGQIRGFLDGSVTIDAGSLSSRERRMMTELMCQMKTAAADFEVEQEDLVFLQEFVQLEPFLLRAPASLDLREGQTHETAYCQLFTQLFAVYPLPPVLFRRYWNKRFFSEILDRRKYLVWALILGQGAACTNWGKRSLAGSFRAAL